MVARVPLCLIAGQDRAPHTAHPRQHPERRKLEGIDEHTSYVCLSPTLWRLPMFPLARNLLIAGLAVGIFVGLVGTGGAFIIPALVYLFKMDQLKAQGTALLIAASPVWIFPFIPYYRAGHYDL